MKNLLLIGEYYSDNLGDGVLCETVERYIESKTDVKIDVLDLSLRQSYPRDTSKQFCLWKKELIFLMRDFEKFLTRFRIEKYRHRLDHYYSGYSDYLISILDSINPVAILFAGGHMFKDTFITRVGLTVKEAAKRNIPVIFNACGCSNYLSKQSALDLSGALCMDCVRYISVRDGYSRASRLVGRNMIYDTFDTAIISSQFFESTKQKKDVVGIGIMFSKNHDPYNQIHFWMKIIRYLLEHKISFELFCNGDRTDYKFIQYMLKRLRLTEERYLVSRPGCPEELVKLISSYPIILSMRLHSLILAYSLGIPAIAISWDEKVDEFYEKIDQKRYCFSLSSRIQDILLAIDNCKKDRSFYKRRNQILTGIEHNMSLVCGIIQGLASFNRA